MSTKVCTKFWIPTVNLFNRIAAEGGSREVEMAVNTVSAGETTCRPVEPAHSAISHVCGLAFGHPRSKSCKGQKTSEIRLGVSITVG